MPLGPDEIYLFARHAGFSPDQAVTMTAVAMAESGGNIAAHNPHGEDSRGLWQVNLEAHEKFSGLDASDPLTNARMAYEVSGGGGDIGRWTVTHGDKGSPYLKFREQAEAASRSFGENGQGQWNPPANYHSAKVAAGPGGGPEPPAPLPTGLPDDTNADFTPAFGGSGQTMAAQSGVADPTTPAPDPDADVGQDTDQDGLLDRYEKTIGTDADSVDSDRDGFSDHDELLEFGTDPTQFGSNPLGATGTLPEGPAAPSDPSSGDGGPTQPPADDVGLAPGVGVAPDVGVAPAPAAGGAPAAISTLQPAAGAAAAGPAVTDGGAQFIGPGAGGGAGGNQLDVFLDAMVAQDGDTYVFGAEVNPDDVDPDTFDCSEIIEWAGAQAGVEIPDGSFNQYLHAKNLGAELTVEEALRTPGAMLFKFSSTPVSGGGRPRSAHVAISLGDGRTIEARSSRDGVGIFEASSIDWTHGGFVPDLGTELSGDFGPGVVTEPVQPIQMGVDSDEDGLLDSYERMIGTDPFNADTDRDGFIDSLELYEHRSDPLDFTDNALTPGSTGGFRPPLTTDVPPGAEPPPPFGGSGTAAPDVGLAPGTTPPPASGPGPGSPGGADSGSGGSGPADDASTVAEDATETTQDDAADAVEEAEDAIEDAEDAADEAGETADEIIGTDPTEPVADSELLEFDQVIETGIDADLGTLVDDDGDAADDFDGG